MATKKTTTAKPRNRRAQDATLINIQRLWKHVAALEHNAKNLKARVVELERAAKRR